MELIEGNWDRIRGVAKERGLEDVEKWYTAKTQCTGKTLIDNIVVTVYA